MSSGEFARRAARNIISCMNSSGVMRRTDGSSVAYAEYGDPKGEPVLFFHGWPSSCTMAELTHNAAQEMQFRIISPDRPGISGSTFRANRTLQDWPPLIDELADYLQLDAFRIFAISGGAPYAYATGAALSDRVRAMAIVSGAPPITELADHSGLLRLYRWGIQLDKRIPRVLRALFHVAQPFASRRIPLRFRPLMLKTLQPCDAEVLQESRAFEACFESSRRAWQTSANGVLTDAEIYIRPWPFRLEDVRVPVRLWHGTSDRAFHHSLAKLVAARLPACELRIINDAGHYSLPIRYMRDILRNLKGS